MAKQMSVDTLVKKLKAVSNTQDSIPMLGLWIIHHKAHYKLVVEQWVKVVKASKPAHRLTLLYLCNDVIQNSKRKNASVYKEAFAEIIPEVITHFRDASIQRSVQRVLNIWKKRAIFDSEYTDQLMATLLTNRAPEKLRNKLLIEYQTSTLIDGIKSFKQMEDDIDAKQNYVQSVRVDISNTEAIKKLKDKVGGERFFRDFEESAGQLESFLAEYETFVDRRKSLLEVLEKGTIYYHAQYHDVKEIVDLYQRFEGRVSKMKRSLDKVKDQMIAQFPSPPPADHDAPSPPDAFTPPRPMNDDMDISDDEKPRNQNSAKSALDGDKKTAAESVLKLLAGLDPVSGSETAADALKRVVSGLVKRPGLRGASSVIPTITSDAKAQDAAPMATFRITRSVVETTPTVTRKASDDQAGNSSKPSAPVASVRSASPPSPTGSPELNISSPPRHQSLESRLADIFSVDSSSLPPSTVEKPVAKEPPPPVEVTTEIVETVIEEEELVEKAATEEEEAPMQQGTSIPVISVLRHNADHFNNQPDHPDGSATPTMDEVDFKPFPSPVPANNQSSALSFLANFMGQATKTELTASISNIAGPVLRQPDRPSYSWSASDTATAPLTPSSSWQPPTPSPPVMKPPTPVQWQEQRFKHPNKLATGNVASWVLFKQPSPPPFTAPLPWRLSTVTPSPTTAQSKDPTPAPSPAMEQKAREEQFSPVEKWDDDPQPPYGADLDSSGGSSEHGRCNNNLITLSSMDTSDSDARKQPPPDPATSHRADTDARKQQNLPAVHRVDTDTRNRPNHHWQGLQVTDCSEDLHRPPPSPPIMYNTDTDTRDHLQPPEHREDTDSRNHHQPPHAVHRVDPHARNQQPAPSPHRADTDSRNHYPPTSRDTDTRNHHPPRVPSPHHADARNHQLSPSTNRTDQPPHHNNRPMKRDAPADQPAADYQPMDLFKATLGAAKRVARSSSDQVRPVATSSTEASPVARKPSWDELKGFPRPNQFLPVTPSRIDAFLHQQRSENNTPKPDSDNHPFPFSRQNSAPKSENNNAFASSEFMRRDSAPERSKPLLPPPRTSPPLASAFTAKPELRTSPPPLRPHSPPPHAWSTPQHRHLRPRFDAPRSAPPPSRLHLAPDHRFAEADRHRYHRHRFDSDLKRAFRAPLRFSPHAPPRWPRAPRLPERHFHHTGARMRY